jgi:para-nitrobenzyl esterase
VVTGPVVTGLTQAEDCQVLSVAAPVDASGRDLPVLVWIHGGAYLSGGGEAPKYDPVRLAADGDLVVVSITYRLGVLGYLAPSTMGIGNLGLLDQREALRWVRREIRAFGGDPDRVTVAGQSAGADSIYCLLMTQPEEVLFQRAILSSTPLGLRQGRQPMTDALQEIVDAELGGRSDGPAEDVLALLPRLTQAAGAFGLLGSFPFAPVLGVDPLPAEGDITIALASAAKQTELLVGYTRDEAAAFLVPNAGQAIDDPAMADIVRAGTDAVFGSPSRALADTWRAAGGAAATFVFDIKPPGAPFGACHCIELPHVFGTDWSDAPMLAGAHSGPIANAAIRDTWTNFAHHGAQALDEDVMFTE